MTARLPSARASDRLRMSALLWLGASRLGLWLMPLPRLRALRSWAVRRGGSRRRDTVAADRVGEAVRSASRAVPRATCLAQALAAEAMLRRAGLASDVHLGVRRGRTLAAHAWVVADGEVVVGGGAGPHATLGVLPPS